MCIDATHLRPKARLFIVECCITPCGSITNRPRSATPSAASRTLNASAISLLRSDTSGYLSPPSPPSDRGFSIHAKCEYLLSTLSPSTSALSALNSSYLCVHYHQFSHIYVHTEDVKEHAVSMSVNFSFLIRSLTLSLSINIYIYMCVCVYVCVLIRRTDRRMRRFPSDTQR